MLQALNLATGFSMNKNIEHVQSLIGRKLITHTKKPTEVFLLTTLYSIQHSNIFQRVKDYLCTHFNSNLTNQIQNVKAHQHKISVIHTRSEKQKG